MLTKILAFASIVEVATGLALILTPRFVVGLLLDPSMPVEEIPIGQILGIAILALGLASWPVGQHNDGNAAAFRGMLLYNLLIALFLAYLYIVGHQGGALLWPAVALHAVVALLLVWTWRGERRVGRQT